MEKTTSAYVARKGAEERGRRSADVKEKSRVRLACADNERFCAPHQHKHAKSRYYEAVLTVSLCEEEAHSGPRVGGLKEERNRISSTDNAQHHSLCCSLCRSPHSEGDVQLIHPMVVHRE